MDYLKFEFHVTCLCNATMCYFGGEIKQQTTSFYVYRLNVECWKNTRIRSTNSLSVLPTSQVYQPINHRNLWSITLYINNSEDMRFFHGFTGIINHT